MVHQIAGAPCRHVQQTQGMTTMGPAERHAVLERMHADGKKLTVDTYSAAVGGGDRTRLTRELRTFREQIASRGDRLELPQPFVHALDVFRHMLAAGTTELISGADARARIVEDSLRWRAREDLDAATGRLTELQDTHEEAVAQLADTQRLAEERSCQIATLEQRLRDVTHQLDRLRDATDTERSRLTAAIEQRDCDLRELRADLQLERTARAALAGRLHNLRAAAGGNQLEGA
jgi:DNA repair exonuclease SbcCD ATPase subunit